MQLTVHLIEQVAALLRSHVLETREKRSQPRVGLRARTRVRPLLVDDAGPRYLDVWVRDLSVGGIGLTCHYPLASGTLFIVVVNGSAEQLVDLQYRVMHAREVGTTGVWVVGAKFDRLLTPDALNPDGPFSIFIRRSSVSAVPTAA